jgi:hypothetical protein
MEAKQRWSVIGWVTKNVLSRAPPCFGRHVKPLVPAALQSLAPTPARGGVFLTEDININSFNFFLTIVDLISMTVLVFFR